MIETTTRVLLVDDFSVVRLMLRRCLEDLGFKHIDEASDGEEGLIKLNEALLVDQPYGLLFIDWSMPKMSGVEVLSRCRQNSQLQTLPIVMVTAEGDRLQVIKAMSLGANDYVIKPFAADIIAKKIESLVAPKI